MSEYIKTYRIGDHDVTVRWGSTTAPVVTWSPPITNEQRQAVEATEGWEDIMMGFIGEALHAVHGTEVFYVDPDTAEVTHHLPAHEKKKV
jgi:hypothetical protein